MARHPTLLIALLFALFPFASAVPAYAVNAPEIDARAYALIDGTTGEMITGSNADKVNYPASTTKLMTALVAVEHGKLDDVYTVDAGAVDLPGDSSLCGIRPGEKQSLRSLLYGLLLASGNDCALAIARGETGGKTQVFVDWMNAKAKELGLTHTHFTNPHGLHNPDHYTSARDLALIARAAFADPTVQKMAGTPSYKMPGHDTMTNHNRLLFSYPGMVGGKTGFTDEAECTLVTAASRGGRYLIGVVMGEPYMDSVYTHMSALLDYGFSSGKAVATGGPAGAGATATAPAAGGAQAAGGSGAQAAGGSGATGAGSTGAGAAGAGTGAAGTPVPPVPGAETMVPATGEESLPGRSFFPQQLMAVAQYVRSLPDWAGPGLLATLSLLLYRAEFRRRRLRRQYAEYLEE